MRCCSSGPPGAGTWTGWPTPRPRPSLDARSIRAWAAAEQSTFLGRGWTVGLAHEAALKFRETSSSWAESYPAMDYRHGPISIADPGPYGLDVRRAARGPRRRRRRHRGDLDADDRDPLVELVMAQRVAVDRALALGLDPDPPRNLTRSVVLTG